MSLKEYARKRDFRKTAEPRGRRPRAENGRRFVIQKHAASRLHYDFRLELGGALKSWAVPKGVPYRKGERRLAVQVEDHPADYIDFEGTIPAGQYGGGTVMVWDTGTFDPLTDSPLEELEHGKLHFVLRGKKLQGEWYLVRLRERNEWLLIKGGEDAKPVGPRAEDRSAVSGRSMAAITRAPGRVWDSSRADDGLAPPRRTPAKAVPRGGARNPGRQPTRGRAAKGPSPKSRATGPRRSGGKALPDFVAPMQALLVDTPPRGAWIYEIKFDGFRALGFRDADGARLRSRNNHDLGARFPEVAAAVATLDCADALIDGEIVALDEKGRSSFQLLQAYDLGQQRPPILFYAFDLLYLDGRDLRPRPLTERKAELERLLGDASGVIRLSRSLGEDAGALLTQARKLDLEGLIGKRPDSPYEPGRRSGAWIKLKLHHEQEFVIGGYTPPGGTRAHFGALLVGVQDGGELKFAGKVGTGFNAGLLRTLYARMRRIATDRCPFADLPQKRSGRGGQAVTAAEMRRCHWVRPELVCELKFSEWTRDGRLRQPVFLGLRDDKPAGEVVREEA